MQLKREREKGSASAFGVDVRGEQIEIDRVDAHAAAPGIWGLGIGVWDLGFGVWDLGSGTGGLRSGVGDRVWDLRSGIWGSDLGSGIWGLGLESGVWFAGSESGVFARGVRDFGPRSGRITSVSDTHTPEHEVK